MTSLPQRRHSPILADLSPKLVRDQIPAAGKMTGSKLPQRAGAGDERTLSWLPRRKQWGVAPVRVARAVPHRAGASATVDADRQLAQEIIEA
jgi:hypothetical protein